MTHASLRLEAAIEQAAIQYYRLVLLVGEASCGKTAALQAVACKFRCQHVNVNLDLSKRMLELPRVHRPRQVQRLLQEVITATTGDLVLLDNLEVLFDTSLEIEPFRLLQVSSRNRTVVATWSGTYREGTLTYAEPGHPEFMQVTQPEAIIVALDANEHN